MPKAISQVKLNTILAGLDAGHKYAQIRRDARVSHGTISNVRSEYRPDIKTATAGLPRKLSQTAVRYAVRLVTHNNHVSAVQATRMLCELSGGLISPETVCCALKEAVKQVKKLKLTRKAKLERIAFAEAHLHWTIDDWWRVLWSEETKINRLGSDGIKWAWTRGAGKLNDNMVVGRGNFGGGLIMFCGCMGYKGTVNGCKLERTLNKEVYLEILGDDMERSQEDLGLEPGEVIFRHDNASAHKAKVCLNWLDESGIEVMEWPAYSSDLNSIENLWTELNRRLGTYEYPPQVYMSYGIEFRRNGTELNLIIVIM
ncbi:Transposase [Ceratobasidium sp. AG-Ba]|nr:Transposase [Ceratobasidium sp. AG-Ba]QRW15452.1 Transposase [Ceratobasidium sp. AG-Ba]